MINEEVVIVESGNNNKINEVVVEVVDLSEDEDIVDENGQDEDLHEEFSKLDDKEDKNSDYSSENNDSDEDFEVIEK